MTSHEHYRELVAGHALSALEPEDEQLLLAHLAACAPCSRELVGQHEALAHLAYAVEPVEPPASLFDGIRAQVLETDPGAFDAPAVPAQTGPGLADVIPLAARRRLGSRPARLVTAAASVSVAAIVGLGAWNIALHQDNVQQDQVSAQFEAALETIKAEPGQTVSLRGEGGEVNVVAVMHDGRMDLVTDGFDTNGRSDRYVVWGQNGTDNPEALADFTIDSDGIDVVRGVATIGGQVPQTLLVSRELGPVRSALPVAPQQPIYAQGVTGA